MMDKLDLIIDALEGYFDDRPLGLDKMHKAIAAAHELRDDLYAQYMEQPTPKQSGVFSVRDIRLPWYKYATDGQILDEVKLRGLINAPCAVCEEAQRRITILLDRFGAKP